MNGQTLQNDFVTNSTLCEICRCAVFDVMMMMMMMMMMMVMCV